VEFIGSAQNHVNIARLRKQSLMVFTLISTTGHTVRDYITGLCHVSVHVSK
jgi:hypothetical protein